MHTLGYRSGLLGKCCTLKARVLKCVSVSISTGCTKRDQTRPSMRRGAALGVFGPYEYLQVAVLYSDERNHVTLIDLFPTILHIFGGRDNMLSPRAEYNRRTKHNAQRLSLQSAKAWFWRGKAKMDAGDLEGSATDLQEVRYWVFLRKPQQHASWFVAGLDAGVGASCVDKPHGLVAMPTPGVVWLHRCCQIHSAEPPFVSSAALLHAYIP